jgi:S1-C subfamily serine protease
MNWHKLTVAACVGSLLITLSTWAANIRGNNTKPEKPFPLTPVSIKQPPIKQLYSSAQAITVKVMSRSVLGSGILLQRQGSVYTVLTNAHVLRAGNPPYRIQTDDNHIWSAQVLKDGGTLQTNALKGNDLALLLFRSTDHVYTVASLGSLPSVGQEVFAAGFPSTEKRPPGKNFVVTTGRVSLLLQKALEGGYQVGHTNDIEKGMSGGPLLDRRGFVVGVNGIHAYPLWDAPSVFADGSEADPALHQKIIHLSWAVPINTVRTVFPSSMK